VYKKEEKRRDE